MSWLKNNLSNVEVLKLFMSQFDKQRAGDVYFSGVRESLENFARSLIVLSKSSMPKKTTVKVKKVTKKTAPKKAPRAVKKTSAGKATATRGKKEVKVLACASDDKCFWTTDGQILKNLDELQMAFGTMGDEVFLHHVTKEKNDFADWVEHVLADAECASALRKSKKPASARTVVIKHLRQYSL